MRGEEIVARVLDATIEELAQTGFEAMTLDRVAARAGVNRTTIYRRWPTREALVQATMDRTMGAVVFDWDTGSLRGDLAELITRARSTLFAPGMVTLLRMAKAPRLSRRARASEQAKHANALAMLTRARARGELRGDVDPVLYLDSLLGMLFARLVFRGEPLDDAFVAGVLDYFVTIAAPPTGRRGGSRTA